MRDVLRALGKGDRERCVMWCEDDVFVIMGQRKGD